MKRFAFGILAGCIGMFGLVAAVYGTLAVARPENMPAPTITRLSALDEKLRYLRRNPDLNPQVLAIGSSIAWRQLDGAAFDAMAERPRAFLNGATVRLQMHQTRELLDFYLGRFGGVRSVLLMAGPPDFEDCSDTPAALMPEDDAAAYAFGELPEAWFYMRYFAPQRFVQAAAALPERQKPMLGDLYMDRWGSGPLHVPDDMKRGLRYGPSRSDPACLEALNGLIEDMRKRNIDLTIVLAPVHPAYREQYPEAMAMLCTVAQRLQPALEQDRLRLLQYQDDPRYRAEDFFDAFHLQYPAVKRFSQEVARAMQTRPAGEMLMARSGAGMRDAGQPLRSAAAASGCGMT